MELYVELFVGQELQNSHTRQAILFSTNKMADPSKSGMTWKIYCKDGSSGETDWIYDYASSKEIEVQKNIFIY